jgi:hypothetical protein
MGKPHLLSQPPEMIKRCPSFLKCDRLNPDRQQFAVSPDGKGAFLPDFFCYGNLIEIVVHSEEMAALRTIIQDFVRLIRSTAVDAYEPLHAV